MKLPSPIYQIANWDQYETADSRKRGKLSWVALPLKHDGRGFKRIMRHEDGMRIFAAWILILQVAAKCPKRGILADEKGTPLTPEDVAFKTDSSVEIMEKAFTFLSSDHIGWLESNQHDLPTKHQNLPISAKICRQNEKSADEPASGYIESDRQILANPADEVQKSADVCDFPAENGTLSARHKNIHTDKQETTNKQTHTQTREAGFSENQNRKPEPIAALPLEPRATPARFEAASLWDDFQYLWGEGALSDGDCRVFIGVVGTPEVWQAVVAGIEYHKTTDQWQRGFKPAAQKFLREGIYKTRPKLAKAKPSEFGGVRALSRAEC